MRWMRLLSELQHSPLGSRANNPHPEILRLAEIYFFATYSIMMTDDEDILDESLVLEEIEGEFEEEEREEEEQY